MSDGTADYAYLSPGDGSAPLSSYTPATSRATYLGTDLLGSVRLATDPSGATIGAGAYDAWGVARPYAGGSGATQLAGLQGVAPFGYAGQQRDAGPGTYAMRARRYDPATGRFQSQDPLAYSPQVPVTINPYEYAGNMPTGVTDPSGQGWLPIHRDHKGSNLDGSYEIQIAQQILGSSALTGSALSEEEVPVFASGTCARTGSTTFSANLVRADGAPSGGSGGGPVLGGQVWDMEHVRAFRGSPGPTAIASGIRTHLIDNARKNGLYWSTNPACNGTYNHCGPYQELHAALRPGGNIFDVFGLRGTSVAGTQPALVFALPGGLGTAVVWSGGPGLILYDVLPQPTNRCPLGLEYPRCFARFLGINQVTDTNWVRKGLALVSLATIVIPFARGALRLGGALGNVDRAPSLAADGETLDTIDPNNVGRVIADVTGEGAAEADYASEVTRPTYNPPVDRHYLLRIKWNSPNAELTTVIDPSVNVAQDVADINAGRGTQVGNEITVNGRTYGLKGTSPTLYPIDGDGLYQLDRAGYAALKAYITKGIDGGMIQILSNPYISDADNAAAEKLYAIYLRYKGK